jgi:uncharacterized oligopeptide transporter (OPT) family protein
METKKQLSNYEIFIKGQLKVNLPAILIIFSSLFGLTIYADLSFKISVIVGGILSWIYWSFAIKKWIKWAIIENNIEKDRVYKIGKNGFLLWNMSQIDEVIDNKKKPWF